LDSGGDWSCVIDEKGDATGSSTIKSYIIIIEVVDSKNRDGIGG